MERSGRQLTEFESKSLKTVAQIAGQKQCLLLINQPEKLSSAVNWMKSHALDFYNVTAVIKLEELNSPIVLRVNAQEIVPPFLKPITQSLINSLNPSILSLYALPPLELTTTVTSLLRNKIDLLLIVGCQCLSRGEYENVAEFNPLIEEIILKEAIQPVILFK